jgi:hypothetical protein
MHALNYTENEAMRAESCYHLARAFHAERDYEEAFRYYYQATHLAPEKFVLPLFNLGQMKDIDEIVLGKKSNNNNNNEQSEWKQCFDEILQSIYYWNTKTNECSWDPPLIQTQNHLTEYSIKSIYFLGSIQSNRFLVFSSTNVDRINGKFDPFQ